MEEQIRSIQMGSVEDLKNFVTAVITEAAFDKITGYIDDAKNSGNAEILWGGDYDKTKGYFIEPTVILTSDPKFKTMEEEIFGPVLTIYIYEDDELDRTLDLLDETSPYGLTGAVFARDREVIVRVTERLRYAAGNLDRKSTRLNSSHVAISYAVFCLKKKKLYQLHI